MQFDCLNTYILQSNNEIKMVKKKMVIVGCYIHQCAQVLNPSSKATIILIIIITALLTIDTPS
jgi:hypothetical protein